MGAYLSTEQAKTDVKPQTDLSGEIIKPDLTSALTSDKSLKTEVDLSVSENTSADSSDKSLKTETNPESKSETNPGPKPETNPEPKPETEPESKSETNPEPAKVVEIEPATVTQNTDVSKKSKRKGKNAKHQK